MTSAYTGVQLMKAVRAAGISPVAIKKLVEPTRTSFQAASRHLDRLAEDGYVEISWAPGKGTTMKFVALTEKGRQYLASIQ